VGLYLSDLNLTPGDGHLTVLGKGEQKRTVLPDDPKLVGTLKRYLHSLPYM